MEESAFLLELHGVSKSYEGPAHVAGPPVLSDLSLALRAGESLAVVGPSGSGKSTLLNLIGALLAPSAGRVIFAGRDLAALGADELADLRNRAMGFVFQAHHLLPQCTVLENVLVPTLVRRGREERAAARERGRALLERVGLGARLDYRPARLSGGECQRAAVVRALINEPRLLLADEPTGSLDGRTAAELGELLVELNRERGVTLITVTHSERLASLMGRVLELRAGRLAPRGEEA